jgi:predicted DNA-binding transcriptional regulator AlpA
MADTTQIIDPLLTAREGAALLQISEPTFWRWVANSTLPKPIKLGGMSRWPRSDFLAFIEKAKTKRDTAAQGRSLTYPPSAQSLADGGAAE